MTPEEEQWLENPERYRILMDGRWELKDLYTVPHYFEQCYLFIYCFDATVTPISIDRIASALRGYPWRGGYSYLNIYSVLRTQISWRDRPRIREIKYASPGWLDIALNHDVALQVAIVTKTATKKGLYWCRRRDSEYWVLGSRVNDGRVDFIRTSISSDLIKRERVVACVLAIG